MSLFSNTPKPIKINKDIVVYGKTYEAGLEFTKLNDNNSIQIRKYNALGSHTDMLIRMSDLFPPTNFIQVTVDKYFETIMTLSGEWGSFTLDFDIKLPDGRIFSKGSTFEKVSDNVVECESAPSSTGKFITQLIRLDKLGMTANELIKDIDDFKLEGLAIPDIESIPDGKLDINDLATRTQNTPEDWAKLERDNTKLKQVFCPYNADMVIYDVHNARVNDLCGPLTKEKYHEIMRRSTEETQFDGLKTFKCKACALGAIANEHDHKEPGEYTLPELPNGDGDEEPSPENNDPWPTQSKKKAPTNVPNNQTAMPGACNTGSLWNSAGSNTATNNPFGPSKPPPIHNSWKNTIDVRIQQSKTIKDYK